MKSESLWTHSKLEAELELEFGLESKPLPLHSKDPWEPSDQININLLIEVFQPIILSITNSFSFFFFSFGLLSF